MHTCARAHTHTHTPLLIWVIVRIAIWRVERISCLHTDLARERESARARERERERESESERERARARTRERERERERERARARARERERVCERNDYYFELALLSHSLKKRPTTGPVF